MISLELEKERMLQRIALVTVLLTAITSGLTVAQEVDDKSGEQTGYDLSWHTVDGGVATFQSGSYSLSGTIGQPDAGTESGGSYVLEGGFWPAAGAALVLFADGFESGDMTRWSSTTGP